MSTPAAAELRSFLAALAGQGVPAGRLPPELRRLAVRVTHGDADEAGDLVAAALLDLLERRGQAGSIEHLLELDDHQLRAALRRRLLQVRAAAFGSRSRVTKALRAHVAAALEGELPVVDALPLSLVVGDRLSGTLIREAVAHLLGRADAPPREPRQLAATIVALYFGARAEDVRTAAHGEDDAGHEVEVLRRVDADRHVDRLRQQLGELGRVVARRACGMTLAQAGAGAAASTVHDQLRRAVVVVREHAHRHGLVAADLEPVELSRSSGSS